MKLATIKYGGEARAAVVEDGCLRVLGRHTDVLGLLQMDADERDRCAREVEAEIALDNARLLAPIAPTTIRDFSVFEQHVEGVIRNGNPTARVPDVWYESPFCYFTNPHALTNPGDAIPIPPGCELLDFELEVAAVIGRAGSNIHPSQGEDHIAGYTIFNDWSARDLQLAEMKLGLGTCKGKDFANTLGPWVVTPDELDAYRKDDRIDVRMRAEINGERVGEDTLANMAWSFGELVAYASRATKILPGDVLGSGTCGSGCLLELWGRRERHEPPPLKAGDTVSLHVDGIGMLENTVAEGGVGWPLPSARRRP